MLNQLKNMFKLNVQGDQDILPPVKSDIIVQSKVEHV